MKGNFKNIIQSNQLVLVDFYADWCWPCKMQSPILREVSVEIGSKARIIKIDVDKNQTVADKFKIRGVPTFILFKNGQIVWRQSGGMDMNTMIHKIKPSI